MHRRDFLTLTLAAGTLAVTGLPALAAEPASRLPSPQRVGVGHAALLAVADGEVELAHVRTIYFDNIHANDFVHLMADIVKRDSAAGFLPHFLKVNALHTQLERDGILLVNRGIDFGRGRFDLATWPDPRNGIWQPLDFVPRGHAMT